MVPDARRPPDAGTEAQHLRQAHSGRVLNGDDHVDHLLRDHKMIRRCTARDGSHRISEKREKRLWKGTRDPVVTGVGSAAGAAILLAAAAALGTGAVGFATSVVVGIVLGGWAGARFSQHRARTRAPREAVRRRRSIHILRITRTLRRRRFRRPSRRSGVSSRLMEGADLRRKS